MGTRTVPADTSMADTALFWQSGDFEKLSSQQLYRIMEMRQRVFVVEQDCVYRDLDNLDQQSHHLCAWQGDSLFAYLRALPPGLDYTESAIVCIVVSPDARGMNLGRELVRRGIELNRQLWPQDNIRIGAQAHLQTFYREFGFTTDSEVYDEDGIPHVKMLLRFE